MKRKDLIRKTVEDFYSKYTSDITVVIRYLRRRKKPKLTKDQEEALWYVKNNLLDQTYRRNLLN